MAGSNQSGKHDENLAQFSKELGIPQNPHALGAVDFQQRFGRLSETQLLNLFNKPAGHMHEETRDQLLVQTAYEKPHVHHIYNQQRAALAAGGSVPSAETLIATHSTIPTSRHDPAAEDAVDEGAAVHDSEHVFNR